MCEDKDTSENPKITDSENKELSDDQFKKLIEDIESPYIRVNGKEYIILRDSKYYFNLTNGQNITMEKLFEILKYQVSLLKKELSKQTRDTTGFKYLLDEYEIQIQLAEKDIKKTWLFFSKTMKTAL